MRTRSILFIAGGSYIYGAEEMTLQIIIGLQQRGYHVHVAVNGWNDGKFIQKLQEEGIPHSIIYLGWYYIKKPLWTIDSLWHAPRAVYQFWKLLKQQKPDLVYHSSYQSIFLLYPFLKMNNILSVHDKLSEGRGAFFVKRTDKKVSIYTAPSDYIRKDLIDECKVGPDKIKVVYNGINFDNPVAPPGIDHTEGARPIKIGIVGQISQRKGHKILFTAFNKIALKYPQVQLHVFGQGDQEYLTELKELLGSMSLTDRVIWHGYVSNKDEIYRTVDFCVVPSIKSESFGLVAVEPAIYFKPVIASRIGGLPEIVQDEKTGFLVEPGNPDELADKMEYLVSNPKRITELGIAAYNIYQEKFSMSRMINEVEIILNNI